MQRIASVVAGKPLPATSGRTSPVFNPATGEQIAEVELAAAADVDAAVAPAKEAFPAWRAASLSRRTEILFAVRELIRARRADLAAAVTEQHGKTLADAMGEVARGLENVEFACGVPELLKGGHSEQVSSGVDVHEVKQPLGVVAGISRSTSR